MASIGNERVDAKQKKKKKKNTTNCYIYWPPDRSDLGRMPCPPTKQRQGSRSNMTRGVGYEKKSEVEMDRARTEQDGQVIRSGIELGSLVFIVRYTHTGMSSF